MSRYYREVAAKPEFQEGYEAREFENEGRGACPYADHSPAATAWLAGWDSSQIDDLPEPEELE